METKVCKKCGRELLISNFYVHKQMSDGHLNICKDCVRMRVHNYRENNIDKIREYDRNRPNAKERNRKQRLSVKQDEVKYQKYKEQKNEWAKRNKYKRKAQNRVEIALKNGTLKKSNKCEFCGKINCEIEGHHYNYSKPLDVIWLCTECHGKVHRQYGKIEIDIEKIKKNRLNEGK